MSITALLTEKWSPPKERKESFKGQVVLVTGANTGLGLEAAKKVAALEADKLIVTTRSEDKGEATKKAISQWLTETGSSKHTEVIHMILDMTTASDVQDFVRRLQSTTSSLHSAIINAGVSMPKHETTVDGFEQTLAVNTVNTVYLTHLLLPILVETSKMTHVPSHVTIVSSRNARLPSAMPNQGIVASSQPIHDMSKVENFPPSSMGGFAMYGRSKLILEYSVRHLAHQPELYDGNKKPYVIINTNCPGATKSDLGRNWESWFIQFAARIFIFLFGKPTEKGANAYLTALSQGEESIGQMWANDSIVPEWDALRSADGEKLGLNCWNELQRLMEDWDTREPTAGA